jgi:Flp pilus assembly protein TadD
VKLPHARALPKRKPDGCAQNVSRKDSAAVHFSKVTRLACACALLLSSTAPLRASSFDADVRLTATTTASSVPLLSSDQPALREELTPQFETAQEAASAPVKKRPNLFVRIISAPFRGLAKLFGGGKSDDKTARVKAKDVKPAEAQTAAHESKGVEANISHRTEAPPTQSQPAKLAANAAPAVRAGEKATKRNDGSAPPVVAAPRAAATPVVAVPQTRASEAADEPVDYEPRKFTPFIESAPGDPLSQGRALLEGGYTNEAISELSIAAVAGPDLVEANNLLGLAHDRLGQHKRAQEFYERGLSVAPQNARVLNNLGHSLYLDDRYNESLSRLKTAARLAPANPAVAGNLALVYGRLGKYDDAFKQFKIAGGEFYARTQTAALLAVAGRDRDAIKHYEAARKLNPESSLVLRQLITLYVRTGQREKAEAAERALDKTPAKTGAAASS